MRTLAATVAVVLLGGFLSAAPTEAATGALSSPCGFYLTKPGGLIGDYTHWHNCVDHPEIVSLDRLLWPDDEVCVNAHEDRYLGRQDGKVGSIRGAKVVAIPPHC